MTTEKFELLSERYGPYASWAIWDEENTRNTAIIGEYITELNSRHILVALNISAPLKEHWSNFHFGLHDRKLIKAFNRSNLRGAYMTDLLKEVVEADSGKLREKLKNTQFVKPHIDFFAMEMQDIGATSDSIFVLLGGQVAEMFPKFVPEPFKKNKTIHLLHYSYYKITDNEWVNNSIARLNSMDIPKP